MTGMLGFCSDSHAQQPRQCWQVMEAVQETFQCSDGVWQVKLENGQFMTGRGPLPAQYQPPPADNVGPPPNAMFAPQFLFGGGIAGGAPQVPGR